MAETDKVTFGAIVRFRALEGDPKILQHVATKRGQTLAAYLRDTVMSDALAELGCSTREEAHRKTARRRVD